MPEPMTEQELQDIEKGIHTYNGYEWLEAKAKDLIAEVRRLREENKAIREAADYWIDAGCECDACCCMREILNA